MTTDSTTALSTLSEADLEPLLELLQGGDPEAIARKAGISKARLFKIRDDLLARREQERALAQSAPSKKASRNSPCSCGSGKKFKHCCLNSEPSNGEGSSRKTAEKKQLIRHINTAFDMLSMGQYAKARGRAAALIRQYPNEDRLHDILALGYWYGDDFEPAIEICRRRLAVAESEKAFFIQHGCYRDADDQQQTLSYYYPPLTWLQKYWIVIKAKDYRSGYPVEENAEAVDLVTTLQTADDATRFPKRQEQGLALRRSALKETLDRLMAMGSDAIPYLRPLAVKYTWAGLFVPEILSVYRTESAMRTLIDISMFGFSYASGASLHYLEQMGDAALGSIQDAFLHDEMFDPIKTGIVSVLGNMRTPAAYEMLLALLDHRSPHIVNWAGDALGKFDNIDALPAMMAASERIGGEKMIGNAIFRLTGLANSNR